MSNIMDIFNPQIEQLENGYDQLFYIVTDNESFRIVRHRGTLDSFPDNELNFVEMRGSIPVFQRVDAKVING